MEMKSDGFFFGRWVTPKNPHKKRWKLCATRHNYSPGFVTHGRIRFIRYEYVGVTKIPDSNIKWEINFEGIKNLNEYTLMSMKKNRFYCND